jgi:hypothetical protein
MDLSFHSQPDHNSTTMPAVKNSAVTTEGRPPIERFGRIQGTKGRGRASYYAMPDEAPADSCSSMENIMKRGSRRLFHIKLDDWTWWAWMITTALLILGLSGYGLAFIGAIVVTAGQGFILLRRDRNPAAFSVQLRAAYLLLLLLCYPPPMRWFYWLPTVGTFALIVFGYCLLARILSLLPWNSQESHTLDRWRRTFFSTPDLDRVTINPTSASCAGGLCTIEAQVAPKCSLNLNLIKPPCP